MLSTIKKYFFFIRSFVLVKLMKCSIYLIAKTCRFHFTGMEEFIQLAQSEKCLLILWHNRLSIAPFILSQYTPFIQYAALVSASRDGNILSAVIHSYKNGNTIRVPHLARYKALQDIIRHVEERKQVVIITPDGPRGPRYELKPGIAIAAVQTHANIISLDWKAKQFWELNTWDRLRIPKPFTTIHVNFTSYPPICDEKSCSIEEAKKILKNILPPIDM